MNTYFFDSNATAANQVATWFRYFPSERARYYVVLEGVPGWTRAQILAAVADDYGTLVPVQELNKQ